MRYEFGIIDYSQYLFSGTDIECVPHFVVKLKDNINRPKLISSVNKAMEKHPIFKTKYVFDKKPYLEDNNAELVVVDSENPPKEFGKSTNGYLFRVSYHNDTLFFDFSHGITDGRGMARFITSVLEFYFELPCTYELEPYIPSYELIYDKKNKPFGMKKQAKGFSKKVLPHIKNGKPTQLTVITLKTEELLNLAKKINSSPVAILLPLLSKATYRSLDCKAKKRKVKGYFTADFRKVMNIQTGRNFLGYRHITYDERFEKFELETLGTIYRSMIDLFMRPENVIDFCTRFTNNSSFVVNLKPNWLARKIIKIAAPIVKGDTNIYMSYLGKLPFSEELCNCVEDVNFVIYPDTGYCVLSAIDFNGKFKISLTNNYKTDKILSNFLDLLKENNISFERGETTSFTQATYKI